MSLQEVIIEGSDKEKALEEAAKQLGVPVSYLEAHSFGDDKFRINIFSVPGKMSFKVSEDKMQVFFEMEPPKGAGLPAHSEWIRGLTELSNMKITFGIDEASLQGVVQTCIKNNSIVKNVAVAKGIPPEKGIDSELIFYFKLQDPKTTKDLSQDTAMKGDVLLVKRMPKSGKPGVNVFHEPVVGQVGADLKIICGNNIEARTAQIKMPDQSDSEEVTEYVSKTYGRISFLDNKLDVIPSISISEDKMSIQIDLIPSSCRGTALSFAQIQDVLAKEKISAGIREADLKSAIEKCLQTKKPILKFIGAEGPLPQDGQNGKLEVFKESSFESYLKQASGLVKKDEVLARLVNPTKAVNGSDISGKSIYGKNGEDYDFEVLDGVQVSKETDFEILRAEISGFAVIKADSIEVLPLVEISRDEMSATFDFYPKMLDGSKPSTLFALTALAEAGIVFGIRNKTIEETLKSLSSDSKEYKRVTIAKGELETSGDDGILEKLWQKNKSWTRRHFVKPGETIAIVHPPTKGKPGHTVLGRELRASDGVAYRISSDSGAVLSTMEDGKTVIKATEFGIIIHDREDKISVEWELEISSDKMEVLGEISRSTVFGDTVKFSDISDALKIKKISIGHQEKLIQEYLSHTEQHSNAHSSGRLSLAKGIEPQSGKDERYKFLFSFNNLSNEQLENAKPRELLARKSLDLVKKGDVLVRLIPAGEGIAGSNVYGESVSAPIGKKAPPLEMGSNVLFNEKLLSYVSNLEPIGYVEFTNKKLDVFSPLVIAENKLSAALSIFPPNRMANKTVGKMFGVEDLTEWLEFLQIKVSADLGKATDICERVLQSGEPALNEPIVKGFTPVDGHNEEIKLLLQSAPKSGKLRTNNSMDLRERDCVVNVKEGDEILSVTEATKGDAGEDIFGRPVLTSDGKKIDFVVGENVEKIKTAFGYTLVAKISGTLISTQNSCCVIKTFLVDGDVNFKIGNIKNEQGGVVVRGSVLPDFSIYGVQDVVIEGMVENANIVSEKRVIVLGSVLGMRTFITSIESMELGNINKAEILCHSKVTVRSEAYLPRVKSDDSFTIESSSGRAAGGSIEALNSITLPQCGSAEFSVDTHLSVGRAFASEREIENQILKEGIDENIKKIEGALKVLTNPANLKKLHEHASEVEKLGVARQSLLDRKKDLLSKVKINPNARIEVSGKVYPGTHIHMFNKTHLVKDSLSAVRFRFDEKTEKIVVEDLHGSKGK